MKALYLWFDLLLKYPATFSREKLDQTKEMTPWFLLLPLSEELLNWLPSFLFFPFSLGVNICVCGWACIHTYVELTNYARLAASGSQVSSFFCLPKSGLQVHVTMPSYFTWVLGITLRPSCMQGKCFIDCPVYSFSSSFPLQYFYNLCSFRRHNSIFLNYKLS